MYLLQKSVIPSISELTNQRLFQEFIQRNTFFFAESLRGHAHAPLVIHYMCEAVFFHQPDGVEVAADGLPEVDFAFFVSLFDGAECRPIFMEIHESALFSVDELRCQSAEVVVVVNVVVLDGFDAFRTHVRLYSVDVFFNDPNFIGLERSASVASHTAFALAACQLAAETSIQELVGYYYVVDDNHAAKIQLFSLEFRV